jgi:hypothetical protein
VKRAQHEVAGLGRLDGGGERISVTDFTDQNHIGIFPDGCPEGLMELVWYWFPALFDESMTADSGE